MRRTRYAALILAVLSSTALAGPREDALAVVEQWIQAYNKSDVDALAALYAPDALFFGTRATTLVSKREGIRRYFAALKVQPYHTRLDHPSVLVAADDAVVVTGIDSVEAHRGGRDYAFNGRVTFVIAKRASAWQIVHYHRSPLPS